MAMEEFYRIAVATPALHLGDPDANAGELLRMAEAAADFPLTCLDTRLSSTAVVVC